MTEPHSLDSAELARPQLTIIVPVFNSAQYLPDLLHSFEQQTNKYFRVIFVDDGSTDDSLALLQDWHRNDEHGLSSLVLHKRNGGQSSARNLGLDKLRETGLFTPWTLFVDSDDMLKPNAIETLLESAVKYGVDDLLYSAESSFDSETLLHRHPDYQTLYNRSVQTNGHVIRGIEMLSKLLDYDRFVASPCLQLFSTSFLLNTGIRFQEGIIHEDNLFTALCLLHARRVFYLDEKLYVRRVREGSTMTSPLSWKNVDGYFNCALSLLDKADKYEDEALPLINKLANSWLDSAAGIVDNLSAEEHKRLLEYPPSKRLLFTLTVQERCSFRKQLNDVQSSNADLRQMLHTIETSTSFRVGRVITFLPGRIKRMLVKPLE